MLGEATDHNDLGVKLLCSADCSARAGRTIIHNDEYSRAVTVVSSELWIASKY